jgi:hypothetical protein
MMRAEWTYFRPLRTCTAAASRQQQARRDTPGQSPTRAERRGARARLVDEELDVIVGEVLVGADDAGEIRLHQFRHDVDIFEPLVHRAHDALQEGDLGAARAATHV